MEGTGARSDEGLSQVLASIRTESGASLLVLAEASPVMHVNSEAPPFLLIHGTGDSFVPLEQSEEFCDRLHAAGGKCELYKIKDGGHGLKRWEADKQTKYKEHMVKWLAKELK